eukprot:Seg1010.11 transcript_id=Seg1010.11/GoldUCD/mRNA.D3Y31 product="hypothetical protein" protein_id=Seg1010.11/GoldUCD/D3Y31
MADVADDETVRILDPRQDARSPTYDSARSTDSYVTARGLDDDQENDGNCCRYFCQALTLKALRDAMADSLIPWVTYIAMFFCVFFLLLFVTGESTANPIVSNIFLILFMLAGSIGQLWCLTKKKNPAFVLFTPRRSHHSNSYLMAGVYVFGTGTLFTVILRVLIYIHAEECLNSCLPNNFSRACISHLTGMMDVNKANSSAQILAIFGGFCYSDVAYDMARLIFIMSQMLFLQSFRSGIFNNSGRVKFVLYHTILTNLCIWVKYVLHETHLFGTKKSHYVQRDTIVATALRLEEIMTPFILEYCLMTGGILHSISTQMIQFPDVTQTPSEELVNPSADAAGNDEQATRGIPNAHGRSSNDEHTKASGSQPGLIFGIFFGLILIAASLTFDNSHTKPCRRSQDFFLVYEGLLGLVQLIVIFIISQSLNHHSMHGHEKKPDDYLLIFAFLGAFAFDLMAGYSAAKSLANKDKSSAKENIMILILVVSLFFSRLLQTGVIIFSRRYVPKSSNRSFRRSAARIRQCALFLLTTNLSFWTLDSFIELKDMAQTSYPAGKDIFGDKWVTIVAITYPLTIFFRFHAAAMLFELWERFKFHPKED